MARAYCTLAVETQDAEAIRRCLSDRLGLQFEDKMFSMALGVQFDVAAAPYEFLHGVPGYPGDELEAEFRKEIDLSSFPIHVDISVRVGAPMEECLHAIATALGTLLSQTLATRVIVFFNGTEAPFRVYSRGVIERELRRFSSAWLASRSWVPNP